MENRLLKAEMALHGDNMETLSDYLMINRATLSRKISGAAEFKQREMNMIRDRYKLSDEKFTKMFAKEVPRNESEGSGETVAEIGTIR